MKSSRVFEIAWNRDGQADVADFLPDVQHPQFEAIATELLCVDLERRRRRRPLDRARLVSPQIRLARIQPRPDGTCGL